MGHVIGDVITAVATVGVLASVPVSARAGLMVDVVYSACITLCTSAMVVDDTKSVHSVRDIDPYEPTNMLFFRAVEWTQAIPQSFRSNDFAPQNM